MFDALVELVRQMIGSPLAALSAVDARYQHLVALSGPEAAADDLIRDAPLDYSICQYAVANNEALFVTDTREDPRLAANLAVTELNVISYAGVPVHADNGQALGVICAFGPEPRRWSPEDQRLLHQLAGLATAEIRRREVAHHRDQLSAQLAERNRLLETLLDSLDEGVVATDGGDSSWLVNTAARRMLALGPSGSHAGAWRSHAHFTDVDGNTIAEDDLPIARALRGEHSRQVHMMCRTEDQPDGRWHSVNAAPIRDADGKVAGAVAAGRDVNDLMQAHQARDRYASELEDLYQRAPCGYHSLDATGHIVRMNDTELGWLGRKREDVVGRMNYLDLLTPESQVRARDYWARWMTAPDLPEELELTVVAADGSVRELLIRATAVRNDDGSFVMTRSTAIDISRRKAAEAEVRRLATTDGLTGLLNRRGFFEQASVLVHEARALSLPFALVYVDLDGLKRVNDREGHQAGDRLIATAAQALRQHFPLPTLAARMGGDEFALAFAGEAARAAPANTIALDRAWREAAARSPDQATPAGSFGVRFWESPTFERLEDALAEADAEMYGIKMRRRR